MRKPKTYFVVATSYSGDTITSESISLKEAEKNAQELLCNASYKETKIYRQGVLMRQFAVGYNNHIIKTNSNELYKRRK